MRIIVTDLTRFKNQDLVCLAGINPQTGQCIRPFFEQNNRLQYLNFNSVKQHKVVPGAFLKGDFVGVGGVHAPHTEDHKIVGQLSVDGNATSEEFENILAAGSVTSIAKGFGSAPTAKFYREALPPPHSIITLKLANPRKQFSLVMSDKFGLKLKATITDSSGAKFDYLPVTDLGYSDHLEKLTQERYGVDKLNWLLQEQKTIYVRIGLGQVYAPPKEPLKKGFYLQVNGIYSFPHFRQDLRMYD